MILSKVTIKDLLVSALNHCGPSPTVDDYFLTLKKLRNELDEIIDGEMTECVATAARLGGVGLDGIK